MLKSYFKIAWRITIRSKGYGALNIFGPGHVDGTE